MRSEMDWEAQTQREDLFSLMAVCGHILYHSGHNKSGQARIMHILENRQEIGQKELQELLHIQSGSVSEILTKMEKEDLIERRKDAADHRRTIIRLSQAGREHARQYHERESRDWFSALDAEQREQLKELLLILLESWRQK